MLLRICKNKRYCFLFQFYCMNNLYYFQVFIFNYDNYNSIKRVEIVKGLLDFLMEIISFKGLIREEIFFCIIIYCILL